jgi:hypothetical protein
MTEPPEDAEIEDAEVVTDGGAPALPGAVPPEAVTGYTDSGVPTFDYVRDQIESRYGTSLGAHELASETPEATAAEEQFAAREQAGRDRLEQIRRALREEKPYDDA